MIVDLVEKLLDRGIQLLHYRQQLRKELFETYVVPVFTEFEHVHAAYLESFSAYQDFINENGDSSWIRALQNKVRNDNLFSAGARAKVVRLAESETADLLTPFIAGICEYLMGARLVNPLGQEIHPVHAQRWRQSFIRTLDAIRECRWQMVLDPHGARPPMSPGEIETELAHLRLDHPGNRTAGNDLDALQRSTALWALHEIVADMQYQYDQVCAAFMDLKRTLLK